MKCLPRVASDMLCICIRVIYKWVPQQQPHMPQRGMRHPSRGKASGKETGALIHRKGTMVNVINLLLCLLAGGIGKYAVPLPVLC